MSGLYITAVEGAHRIINAEAVDDLSYFILEDWLAAGFRECSWEYGYEPYKDEDLWRQMGDVCPICFALDGQHFKVKWLLENMTHSAPKYTLSHVNCKCRFRRQDRNSEILDYSEDIAMKPSEIPEDWKQGPVDFDQIGKEMAQQLGLPPDPFWKAWKWDPARMEFMPHTEAGFRTRSMIRTGRICRCP